MASRATVRSNTFAIPDCRTQREPEDLRWFTDAVATLQPIMVNRGQNEFSGERFNHVSHDLLIHLRIDRPDLRQEFIAQLGADSLAETRKTLRTDSCAFGAIVQAELDKADRDTRGWNELSASLAQWVRQRCDFNARPMHPDGVDDHARYIGLKLSYAVLYWRHVIHPQTWKGKNDYLDYLHTADMAYSSVVITESNLAEALTQIKRRTNLRVPEHIYKIDWLRSL